jgi:hypothetical protein
MVNAIGNTGFTQRPPCLAKTKGFTPPAPAAWERNHSGDGRLLSTGLSEEHLSWRTNFQDPVFRATHWLNGIEGREGFEEPFGVQVFINVLREAGIELPSNARFEINADKHGKVTITGLDNNELTRQLEEEMSYNSQMLAGVLARFPAFAKILEGYHETAHIPNISLTFENGRMTVNNIEEPNPYTGGINITA